jgi:Transmembrane domain of unknown function (DUF3566)
MRGNDPEEDGVDHRVEPQSWLTDGAADGADLGGAEDQRRPPQDMPDLAEPAFAADPAGDAARSGALGQPYPNGNSADTVQAPLASANRLPAPPYPAQVIAASAVPGSQQARSLAARITAPFLARPRTGTAQPQRPQKGERPMTARVAAPPKPTGPAKSWDKSGAGKPTRPPKVAVTSTGAASPQSTRKAQLILSRIEPWSVMKFSFMISLVGWVILFVAVAVLYFALSKLGVFHAIQTTIGSVTSSKDTPGTDAGGGWFSASRVLGYTMLVGAVNVILITALATVGSVIYNLVTHIAGGIEVTLKETD